MTGPSSSAAVTRLVDASRLVASGDAVAAWAADVLATVWAGAGLDALYVGTSRGGADEAVAFWSAALATGPALAAPGAFPYTLANAAAGRICVALDVRGPSVTLVGPAARAHALEAARDDVADGVCRRALVVGLDPDGSGAWRLDAEVVSAAPA
ncbi:beta-ketoacyl synthase N-terminal-like domain-containing protein [Cellulomonas sp. HZM]|uniref:beta-ketoacyl synthase N-terminal-like domain-containing protein n=1 Tax=Cellulomonas sp. HZM TaxID=1454010 RepID=UPI0004934438|nr:beta-ketoacyl synthase N-terminal-like domain-containing protein [Cellulomonas sp. HZM]